jgi:hypothetical protein
MMPDPHSILHQNRCFYAAAEGDLYRSSDAGATWERLDVEWPADRRDSRILDFAVVEID